MRLQKRDALLEPLALTLEQDALAQGIAAPDDQLFGHAVVVPQLHLNGVCV
jgi:hypothetical protein